MELIHDGIPPEQWDELLLGMGGHVTQSRAWGRFNEALGRAVYYSSGGNWMWLATERHGRGVKYLAVSYGPTISKKTQLAAALTRLEVLAKGKNLDFVRMEPVGELSRDDLVAAKLTQYSEVQPTHTHILDLRIDEATLRQNLESGHRNRINTADKKGIVVREAAADEIDEFLAMNANTAAYNKIKSFDNNYYQVLLKTLAHDKTARLFFAQVGEQKVCSSIVLDFGPTRYYAFAAAYQDINRKLGASVVLLWHLITSAKAEGKTEFDFWGVAPADQVDHPWAGLSAFKRGFGGQDKSYLGTWDLPLKPLQYKAYRGLKRIMR